MLLRTDAIVLRSMPYGETSRIVTFLSRDHGKMSAMAKGARLPKSKFGSALQVMSIVQIVLYHRSSRTLQTLAECALRQVTRLDNMERIGAGMRMVELTNALLQAEEIHPDAYDLLALMLTHLQGPHTSTTLVQLYFEMQLASILGFAPSFEREAVRTLPKNGGMLNLESGLITAHEEATRFTIRASYAALRMFAILSRAKPEVILRMKAEQEHEVRDLVTQYVRFHVAEAYPERGRKVMSQLKKSL